MWLSLITNKYLIAGIAVSLLVGYVVILRSQLSAKDAKLGKVQAELDISQASVKSLQVAIADQNSAIEQLKIESDKRSRDAAVALEKARAATLHEKARATQIAKLVKPQDQSDCDAANDLINKEIEHAPL
jgi:hypothetical protein